MRGLHAARRRRGPHSHLTDTSYYPECGTVRKIDDNGRVRSILIWVLCTLERSKDDDVFKELQNAKRGPPKALTITTRRRALFNPSITRYPDSIR
jgi:hypothetical protein